MKPLRRGRLVARLAETEADVIRAQALRWRAFRARSAACGQAEGEQPLDQDAFDARCLHLLVEDTERPGQLLACARVLPLASGAEIAGTYTAQYYDLRRLSRYPGAMLEVGRFCTRPGNADPEVLRTALGGLARLAEARGASMLIGASSFRGTDPAPYAHAFGHLARNHLAPAHWMPAPKAREVMPYAGAQGWRATQIGAAVAGVLGALTSASEGLFDVLLRLAPVPGGVHAGATAGALAIAHHTPPLALASPNAASGAHLAAARPALPVLQIPPLLRSYLTLGGWVSDHAVIDRDLDTLHVFTALEIAAIPPARARLLRALATDQGRP